MMSFQFFLASHYRRCINCMPFRLKSLGFISAFRSLMLLMGALDYLRQTVCNPVFENYVLSHAIKKTIRSHWLCPCVHAKSWTITLFVERVSFLKARLHIEVQVIASWVHTLNCQDMNLFQIQSSVTAVQYKSLKLLFMGLLLWVKPCFNIMEVFQLVCANIVQGVDRIRAKNVTYGCMRVHLSLCIKGAGMWRWKFLKVLVRYELQLTKQKNP